MSKQTPPPPKRKKVEIEEKSGVVMNSSPPATPVITRSGGSKRVIPDTPGSPPAQVLASSPPPVENGIRTVNGSATGPTTNASTTHGTANRANNTNNAATAIAEDMKLANPQFTSGVSIRRPGFPSQTSSSPQTIIPHTPPKARLDGAAAAQQFNHFISQYALNASLPAGPQSINYPQAPQYRFVPTSMAGSYGMPNRPHPIQSRPVQIAPVPIAPTLDYRPREGTPLRRLVDMFPHINEIQGINALTMCRGNFEDAAARITENPLFGVQPMPNRLHVEHQKPNYGRPPVATQQSTTKRTLKAPTQTIQQRYTHLNQEYVPNTFPYNLAPRPLAPFAPFSGPPPTLTQFSVSPPRPVQSKKRKLVRGKSKRLDSDGDSFSEEEEEEEVVAYRDEIFDEKVLDFLNTASAEEISDITFTPLEHVNTFISHRPFSSLEHSRTIEIPPTAEEEEDSDAQPKKKARGRRVAKKGRNIGNRIVDGAEEVLAGYNGVDDLISECETIGKRVREKLAKWTSSATIVEEGALTLTGFSPSTPSTMTTNPSPAPSDRDPDMVMGQPSSLAEDVSLKDYQLIGVNWLHLLYKEGLSCILADEMGLGKTCQVIAFLGGLLERTGGQRGKHLVVVPSSTIENWLREFKRFCPSLVVEPYYGDQKTRAELRHSLDVRKDQFHVIVTTYKLATGAKEDRLFLKGFNFDVCVFDEGHMLKNSLSKQYLHLMKLTANFRVLLTGTPLQNNLTELISLLSFILPTVFAKNSDALKSIFKLKPSSMSIGASAALLSQQRITRAKAMMTPFVLRRRKIHVLKDLPKKHHQIEYCEMHPEQRLIYDEILQKQKDQIAARARGELPPTRDGNNVLMQLRKAASHPLLFRRIYSDQKIKTMSKEIMKEEKFGTPEHSQEAIREDMSYMWDFTLHKLCLEHNSISRFALNKEEWMEAGKIDVLKRLLPEMKARGDRVLLFSFFTMMLDILEKVLDSLGIQYMRLDGQTKVDERQDMIDQFHEEDDVTVFLLSTKAGGFGINLACANTVIIFDGSFNPHDDKQAEDRAHRVGQTRDVKVIRLVVKDTIEEHILHLANTKLALDQEMSQTNGNVDDEEKAEREGEKFVARMLIGKNGEDTPNTGSVVPSRVVTPALES